jgi:hypothetical protein
MQRFSTKYWQTEFNKTSKRSYTMTRSVSFQWCKDGSTCKSKNIIQHINRSKGQKPQDSLNRHRKRFWQNPTPFHDKSSEETSNRRNFPQIIKTIYDKPRVIIILNGKQLKPFPLKSEQDKAVCFHFTPVRMPIIEGNSNNKFRWRCGEPGTLYTVGGDAS